MMSQGLLSLWGNREQGTGNRERGTGNREENRRTSLLWKLYHEILS